MAMDEFVFAPTLDQRGVAFGRDLDAVQAGAKRVPKRAAYPRTRAPVARRAPDLEDFPYTRGGRDVLNDLGERVVRYLRRNEAVEARTRVRARPGFSLTPRESRPNHLGGAPQLHSDSLLSLQAGHLAGLDRAASAPLAAPPVGYVEHLSTSSVGGLHGGAQCKTTRSIYEPDSWLELPAATV